METASAAMAVPSSTETQDSDAVEDLVRRKSFDPQSVVQFFRNTRTYDVMPENGKVAVVEAALSLAELFEVFVDHQLGAASVLSDEQCQGLVTPTHLAHMVTQLAKTHGIDQLDHQLAALTIGQFMAQSDLSLSCEIATPDTTVLDAIELMHVSAAVQLLQIKEPTMDSPVFILSYPRILRYVMSHFQDAEGDDLLDQSIAALQIGNHTAANVLSIPADSTILQALEQLLSSQRTFAAVIDAEGVVLGLLTAADVVSVAASVDRWGWLHKTIGSFIDGSEHALNSCLGTEPLLDVLRRLAQNGSSRIAMVDFGGKLEGVVLLEDLFWHFVQTPAAAPEAELAAPSEAAVEDEDEDSATIQFGRFAVTDFDDDDDE